MSSNQQQQSQDLVTQFKRKGVFDQIRRDLFTKFKDSDVNADLLNKIQAYIDDSVHKDPTLLQNDRSKAAVIGERKFNQDNRGSINAAQTFVDDITVKNLDLEAHIKRIIEELYKNEPEKPDSET